MRSGLGVWRRLPACRNGATAFEFALIAPLFTFLLFSIFEFGFVFVAYGAMNVAANSTARRIAVNDLAAVDATDAVQAKLPQWVRRAAVVTTTATVAPNPLDSTINVRVSAPVNGATPLPYFSLIPNWTMTSSVTVQRELAYED